jgi:hypothetical protein
MAETDIELGPDYGPTIAAAEQTSPKQVIDYDYDAAIEAGLEPADIAQYLASETNYDYTGARAAGIDDLDIISELTGRRRPGPVASFMEGVRREAPVAGAFTTGAVKGFELTPGPPVAKAVGALATGLGSALLSDELTSYFFPTDKPLDRTSYEMGRTFGAGVGTLPVPYAVTSGLPVGQNLFMQNLYKFSPASTPVERMLATAQTKPMRFALAELTTAAAAAGGAGVSEELFPGNELARFGAEVGAGSVAGLTQSLPIVKVTNAAVKKLLPALTTEGRKRTLGNKLVTVLNKYEEDPDAAMTMLLEDDEIDKLAKEFGVDLGPRTAAIKSKSPTLAKIQAQFMKDERMGPTLRRAAMKNLEGLSSIVDLMIALDDPDALAAAAELQKGIFDATLQARLEQANSKAAESAAKVGRAGPEDRSRAGEIILEMNQQVLKEAREQERLLYNAVDKTEPVGVDRITSELDTIQGELLPESPFPTLITRFVNRVAGRDGEDVGEAFVADIDRIDSAITKRTDRAAALKAEFDEKAQLSPEALDTYNGQFGDLDARIAERKSQGAFVDFTDMIDELARTAANYREKGAGDLGAGSSLDATTRKRVAALMETKIRELQAEQALSELRYDKSLVTRERGVAMADAADIEAPGATVGELTAFRSEMLRFSRDARAAGNFRDANFYGRMAEAALDDLGLAADPEFTGTALTANQQALKNAHSFSRSLNDVFTRAYAGEIMGKTRTGQSRIPPELLADDLLGGSANATNLKINELENAVMFLKREMGEDPNVEDRIDTFRNLSQQVLRSAAQRYVNPETGRVNMVGLGNWLRDNDQVMRKFPLLRGDLDDAVTAEKVLRDTIELNTKAERDLNQAQRSFNDQLAFAYFLGSDEKPGDLVGKVVSGRNPGKNLNATIRFAKQGGENVVEGLKDSLLDWAFVKAGGANGQINFAQMKSALFSPMARKQPSIMTVLRQQKVISDTEATNLLKVLNEMESVESIIKSQDVLPRRDRPQDIPSAAYDLTIRLLGSAIGRGAGQQITGRQAGIVEAGAGVRFARNLFEDMPATYFNDMLKLAVQEPKMMAVLLDQPRNTNQKIRYNDQLKGFLVGAGLIPTDEQREDVRGFFPSMIPQASAAEMPSEQQLQEYLSRSRPAPAPAPAAPTAAQAPAAPAPTSVVPPSGAGPSPNTRASYSALFPGDVVSPLINQQQQQGQGIMSLGPR